MKNSQFETLHLLNHGLLTSHVAVQQGIVEEFFEYVDFTGGETKSTAVVEGVCVEFVAPQRRSRNVGRISLTAIAATFDSGCAYRRRRTSE